MIRISHHRIKCIGCGHCVEVAPNTWQMNELDGKANLILAKEKRGFYTLLTSDDELDSNMEAQQICPVKIIQVQKI